MKIGKYELGAKESNKERAYAKYACWSCASKYDHPVDFLWHIQYCQSIGPKQQAVSQPMVVK